jgi:steroid 5-alpha reductase family enzyme
MGDIAVLGLAILAITFAQIVTALIAKRVDRVSVVDVTWGLGFALVALVAGLAGDGTPWRRAVLVALVCFWGCRLGWHIGNKHRAHRREDPRYAELLGKPINRGGFGVAVRKVFLVQGLSMLVVSLPVLAGMTLPVRWTWLVWLGVAVWAVGVFFETVGDAQLAAYKADPDRGPVLDRGLWAWTRHPNYFGDSCLWWGIWLAGGLASGWVAGLVAIIGPIAMTYFLAFATGARLLEKTMMARPGYPEYAARTPMFFPRRPRR